MSSKDTLKAINYCTGKCMKELYKLFYMKPVIAYKKLGCAAINDFSIRSGFVYDKFSYYPAILQDGEKKAEKIYSRIVKYDNNGIPTVNGFKQKYWPVTIIQFGLLNYNFYITHKKNSFKDKVISVCDWLCKNIDSNGGWPHNVCYHSTVVDEDILPPYYSAMVQGEAISLLVRGFHLTDNDDYLKFAEKAMKPYTVKVEDGGVLDYFFDLPFYEEYPTNTPSFVLNGFLFSLFGLYDLSQMDFAGSELALRLFDAGYDTLIKTLPLFDGGFCSRYALNHFTCAPNNNNKNPFYHPIHINQLIAMNSIRENKVLQYYISEWK